MRKRVALLVGAAVAAAYVGLGFSSTISSPWWNAAFFVLVSSLVGAALDVRLRRSWPRWARFAGVLLVIAGSAESFGAWVAGGADEVAEGLVTAIFLGGGLVTAGVAVSVAPAAFGARVTGALAAVTAVLVLGNGLFVALVPADPGVGGILLIPLPPLVFACARALAAARRR